MRTIRSSSTFFLLVLNASSRSLVTVLGLGMVAPGCPASKRSRSWRSLTILIDRKFSVIQRTIPALKINDVNGTLIEAHRRSMLVWVQWVTFTGCWPWRAKAAKMEPSRPSIFTLFIAALTTSSPQQLFAWVLRLPVAAQSPVSRKRRTPDTLPLQRGAPQWKKWYFCVPLYLTETLLKNW